MARGCGFVRRLVGASTLRVAAAVVLVAAGVAANCGNSNEEPIVLELEAAPSAVMTGESAELTVRARESNGDPAPDGTVVSLTVAPALGEIVPTEVATTGGVAAATFTAGAVPGGATVTATSGGETAQAQVTVVGRTVARVVLSGMDPGRDCSGLFRISGHGFEAEWRPRSNGTRDIELPQGGEYSISYDVTCTGCGSWGCYGDEVFPEHVTRVIEARGPCGEVSCF